MNSILLVVCNMKQFISFMLLRLCIAVCKIVRMIVTRKPQSIQFGPK